MRHRIMAGAMMALAALCTPAAAAPSEEALKPVLDYARAQKTTGFLIVQDGKALVERNWPAPDDAEFKPFAYERNAAGELLEDVASQQKSFVSMLVAIAADKGLIDVEKPVSAYIGPGWSKAAPDEEAK